jgi:hypothetical protein
VHSADISTDNLLIFDAHEIYSTFKGKGKKMLPYIHSHTTYEVASAFVIPVPIATCHIMTIMPYCRRDHQRWQLSSSSRPKVVAVIEVMVN